MGVGSVYRAQGCCCCAAPPTLRCTPNIPSPLLSNSHKHRVRWYVSSLGSEDAIHTAHWHGISFNMNGHHVDQVSQSVSPESEGGESVREKV